MTETQPRSIEFKPLRELKPDPRNPKSHDLDTIDKSIGRFGVVDPIVQDGRTGYIISGHGRAKALTAMEEAGENPPEGVKIAPTGEWLVPVSTGWASRTDMEAGAALIALNRTTELGGWVDDALLDMLDDLREQEGGLEGIGYEEADIDGLKSYLDSFVASSYTGEDVEEDNSEDGEDGEYIGGVGTIQVSETMSRVIVVYPPERREELYGLLEKVDWISDVRDTFGA